MKRLKKMEAIKKIILLLKYINSSCFLRVLYALEAQCLTKYTNNSDTGRHMLQLKNSQSGSQLKLFSPNLTNYLVFSTVNYFFAFAWVKC